MLILMLPVAFFIGWLIYALLPTIIFKYVKTYTLPISNTGEKRLLLTFDDGPDPRYTYRVLEILKKYNIKAIFFLPAFKAVRYPGIADSIRRDGHMIGCHGHAHRNPLFQGPWTTKKDFRQSSLVWEELGYSPQFYRPPHGCLNLSSLAAATHNSHSTAASADALFCSLLDLPRFGTIWHIFYGNDNYPGSFDDLY